MTILRSLSFEVFNFQKAVQTSINIFLLQQKFKGIIGSGTLLFESLGRRKTALIGGLIGVAATLVGAFSNSYSLMIVVRLLQGM